jgi:hypothetical protein
MELPLQPERRRTAELELSLAGQGWYVACVYFGLIEAWLPVPGHEYYEVSSHGRVRSLDRTDLSGGPRKGRVLKLWPNRGGYLTVGLHSQGRQVFRAVHALVAEAFIGPRSDDYETRHGPDGKLDNRPCNLSYGTHVQNEADKKRDGTWQGGERCSFAILAEDDVREIRRLYESERKMARRGNHGRKWTQRALGVKFGVNQTTIADVLSRKHWAHIPDGQCISERTR